MLKLVMTTSNPLRRVVNSILGHTRFVSGHTELEYAKISFTIHDNVIIIEYSSLVIILAYNEQWTQAFANQ